MPKLSREYKGKNFSVHFAEDETDLLDDWSLYCKKHYTSKSGWLKRKMKEAVNTDKELATLVTR